MKKRKKRSRKKEQRKRGHASGSSSKARPTQRAATESAAPPEGAGERPEEPQSPPTGEAVRVDSQARSLASEAETSPPRRFDAPARALAANLSAFSSKRQPRFYPKTRREERAAASDLRGERAAAPGPPRHDFRRPSLLSEQQVRALDSVHRRYAEQASGTLAAMVRGRAQVVLTEIRQCSYFDFIGSLRNPTCLQLVYCTPGKQWFVAEMTPAILFPILDRLLGGSGDDSTFPIRPFTRLESPLVNRVFQRLVDDLAASWSPRDETDEDSTGRANQRIRFDVRESEHNPLLMQVFGASEPTVVFDFQLTVGSGSGSLRFCLPTKPFESLLGRLVESSTLCPKLLVSDEEHRASIRQRLEDTDLTLTAELASVPIALEDLLRLRPGDVIDTELERVSEISVRVEGKTVFRGQAVAHAGRRAVRVTGFHGEDPILGQEEAS